MAKQPSSPDATPDPLVGRRVGNYVIEKPLAQGGMGAVYLLAHAELPGTFAALKVLRSSKGQAASREMKERFQQEALVAAAIGSHRVVRPLDTGNLEDGTPYILMEYVPGRSLSDEVRAVGPLPVVQALQIALRIADTMVEAHGKGIVHRDLKPRNVMLTREGNRDQVVKILDFGVARATGDNKVAHTRKHAVLGTPGFMSPEAAAGRTTDGRTDVFSLGAMIFYMLTGHLPFPAPSAKEGVANVLSPQQAPPVSTHRPVGVDAVPPVVDALVARALAKDAGARFTSMAELHQALWQALESLSATGGMPAPARAELASIAIPVVPGVHEIPTIAPDRATPLPTHAPERSGSLSTRPGTHAATTHGGGASLPTAVRSRDQARGPWRWVIAILGGAALGGIALGVWAFLRTPSPAAPPPAVAAPATPPPAPPAATAVPAAPTAPVTPPVAAAPTPTPVAVDKGAATLPRLDKPRTRKSGATVDKKAGDDDKLDLRDLRDPYHDKKRFQGPADDE